MKSNPEIFALHKPTKNRYSGYKKSLLLPPPISFPQEAKAIDSVLVFPKDNLLSTRQVIELFHCEAQYTKERVIRGIQERGIANLSFHIHPIKRILSNIIGVFRMIEFDLHAAVHSFRK